MIKESRMIGYLIANQDDQTRYNKRTAQANAQVQNQVHQNVLSESQKTGNVQQTNAAYQQGQVLNNSPLTDQFGSPTDAGRLQEARGVYNLSPSGELEKAAIDRLRAQGMTDVQIREQLSKLQPQVRDTMSNTGLGGSFDQSGRFVPSQQPAQGGDKGNLLFGDQLRQQLDATNMPANVRDFLYKSLKDVQTPTSSGGQEPSKAAPTPGENVNAPTGSQQAPGAGALDQAAAAYPGLTGAFDEIKNLLAQQQKQNESLTLAQLKGGTVNIGGQQVTLTGSEQTANAIDKKIADMETGFSAAADKVQGLLDQAKQQQDDLIAKQEQSARERLAWTENQMLRNTERQKRQAHESLVVQFALDGGYGQPSAIKEVMSSDQEFENRMDDIKSEFGVQRTELSAQFTALSVQNSNNYIGKTIENARTLQSQIERTSLQSISNMQARQQAEQKHVQDYFARQDGIMMEYAKTNLDHAKTMQAMINQDKADKRAKENEAWDRLTWLKTTFPSGSVPDSMVTDLANNLPGIDVRGLLNTATAAEIKARKASGSGTGGYSRLSFPGYQKKSDGSPPTFEDFVRHKETDALQSGAAKFDTSPAAMASYQKEYDVLLNEAKRLDPQTILDRLDDANKNITEKNLREDREATVMRYLKEGRPELADNYVNGLGKTMTGEERKAFEKAAGAKQNVQRVAKLIDEIGQIGPVIGRVRELNPYDDRIVEFNNLVTQTIPGLARGIFGEVGVLTDQDIKTYRQTMANPALTADQARTATRNLLQTIELSIQNQVDLKRAAGVDTRDVGAYFNVQPQQTITDMGQGSTLDASREYALSLIRIPD